LQLYICYIFCSFNILEIYIWFALVLVLVLGRCKYNHIDKHLCNKSLQHIINGEIKHVHLLCYDEALNDEKIAFENVKVNWLFVCLGSWLFVHEIIFCDGFLL